MSTSQRMPGESVLVFGTGAMGSLVAAVLALAGHRVTLTGTWRATIDAVCHRGVILERGDSQTVARIEVVHRSRIRGAYGLVVVAVKSAATAAVAQLAADHTGVKGLVLSVQNGMAHLPILNAAIGSDRFVAGFVTIGATLVEPGRVRWRGGREILLARHPRAGELRSLLAVAGFDVAIDDQEGRSLWRKLAVNCAVNPITALAGCRNGVLLVDPTLRELAFAAAREVAAVAHADGVDLGSDATELVASAVHQTAENRSSMLQDIDRCRLTEIDAINGAVVTHGRALGVPTPVNERLWRALVRFQERTVVAME